MHSARLAAHTASCRQLPPQQQIRAIDYSKCSLIKGSWHCYAKHDVNVDLNDSVDDDDNNNGDTGVGNVNAVVDLCWTRVLHAGKDALKPRDNQMSFLACQSGPVELLLLRLGLELGPMASHNTHDKCLIYFALKPHLSCLIACATTLKIYLPHHTQQNIKKQTREREKRKQKQQQQQLAHSHTHTIKCCQAFVCCAVYDTPLIYVPSTASGRWLRLFFVVPV